MIKNINIISFAKKFILGFNILDKRRKFYLYILSPLSFFLMLLEFVTTGILAFLVTVLLKPEWAKSKPLLKKFYDILNFSNDNYFILFLGIVSIAIFVTSTAARYFSNAVSTKLYEILSIFIRSIVFKNSLYSDYKWFLGIDTGHFLQANNDHGAKLVSFILNIVEIVVISFSLIIVIVVAFLIDPVLFLIFSIVLSGVSFIIYYTTKNILYKIGEKANIIEKKNNLIIREILAGIVEIKIHRKENTFFRKHYQLMKDASRINLIRYLVSELISPILIFFLYSGILTFVVYNVVLYDSLEKIIASGSLFLAIAYRGIPRIHQLLNILGSLHFNSQALEDLEKLKLLAPAKKEIIHKKISFNKEINFKDIFFSYDKKPLFSLFNLSIKKNEMVGIIGRSGCGKSTFSRLLLGLLNVQKGKILIDGVPLSRQYKNSWFEQVSYVSQKIYIFQTNILENIAFGEERKNIDMQKISSIAKLPWMQSFLDSLPKGIETEIREEGGNLSGGQIQRIAIARALYKDTNLLIFDEATNSLDNNTELSVIDSIKKLQKKKTIVVIAHRLSTLKNADKIYSFTDSKKMVCYNSYKEMKLAQ